MLPPFSACLTALMYRRRAPAASPAHMRLRFALLSRLTVPCTPAPASHAGDHSFPKKSLPTRNPLLRAWQWWCAYLLPGECSPNPRCMPHVFAGDMLPALPAMHGHSVHDVRFTHPPQHGHSMASAWSQRGPPVRHPPYPNRSAGMGMFSEAYFIFAIGNIEPLFAVQSPDCWDCTDAAVCTCNQTTVDNVQVWQTAHRMAHVECMSNALLLHAPSCLLNVPRLPLSPLHRTLKSRQSLWACCRLVSSPT